MGYQPYRARGGDVTPSSNRGQFSTLRLPHPPCEPGILSWGMVWHNHAIFSMFTLVTWPRWHVEVVHVTTQNPLYLSRTSFSDHVSILILNQHLISFPTVYDMTVFEEKIYFLSLWRHLGLWRHSRTLTKKPLSIKMINTVTFINMHQNQSEPSVG